MNKVLRLPEVVAITGHPRSTIYDQMAKGRFPKPIRLGIRSVGWLESEIIAWQRARIAERDREMEAA